MNKGAIITILLLLIKNTLEITFDEFISLSNKEKLGLDELRSRVGDKVSLEFMKEDIYLIRILRGRKIHCKCWDVFHENPPYFLDNDFDVPASESMIINNLKWRQENAIDFIMNEDFSDFDEDIRGYIHGCDKEGRPVLSVSIGDLDVRLLIISGKGERFMRYADRISEEASEIVRKMQKDGQHVVQCQMILDMSGFNVVTHACPRCLRFYYRLLRNFQWNYPGYFHKLTLVNTPSLAVHLWNTFKGLVAPQLRDVLHIHGMNKGKWQEALFSEIPRSEISQEFGGTKVDVLDSTDFRRSGKVFRCNMTSHDLYS